MKPYDTAVATDCFAASKESSECLVGQLTEPAAATLTHDRLEGLIEERGRELLRQLLQDHLDLRAEREERALSSALSSAGRPGGPVTARPPVPVDAAGITHRAIETGHERSPATVVGPVMVRRVAYRAQGVRNLYLADAVLNLPVGRHSHGLRKRAVLEAVHGSFDTTVAAITRCCGKVVAKRQAQQLVIAAAGDVQAFYAAQVPLPCTAGTLLVISADGKGVPMRPESLRRATRKAAAAKGGNTYRTRLAGGEKTGRKRMATVAAVYDAEPECAGPMM